MVESSTADAGAAIALTHTLLGPDHYVPFIAIGRARGWSVRRTLVVTVLCGAAHVLSSVLIGGVRTVAFWTLVIVFVLGPCEPPIPLLMFPAMQHDWHGMAIRLFGI